MPHELDGTYQVSSVTSYNGPLEKKSDGLTEIKDGKTERYDKANCHWTSQFEIINDDQVEMISVADPTKADSDFSLTKPDGTPTHLPVTYRATLKLSQKGNKIQMSGEVDYDNDITLLTMRKIS